MKLLTLRVMEQDSNPNIGTLNYNSSPGFEANYFSLCASLFLQSLYNWRFINVSINQLAYQAVHFSRFCENSDGLSGDVRQV